MIFKKLFGGGDPEALKAKAERLFESKDYGGALMAYEKARAKVAASERAAYDEAIGRCKDALALLRLAEAKRLLAQGDDRMAQEELNGAFEVVVGEDARGEIQGFVDSLQREEAQQAAADTGPVSDEEQWLLLSGNWTQSQRDELEGHGEALQNAVLTLYGARLHAAQQAAPGDTDADSEGDEQTEEQALLAARDTLESLVQDANNPRYLWLEVARARLFTEDKTGTRTALEAYLAATDAEDVDQAWLGAQISLAQLMDEAGDFAGAMARFTEAVNAFEDDPRPYFAMGIFLRDRGMATEAIELLETATEVGDAEQPDWGILQALGLAYRDAKQPKEAIATLEAVIELWVERSQLDFPPATAVALAELHESDGKLERAADLWAALSRGSDRKNHRRYHMEAARVLKELGLTDEAERMHKRAAALKEDETEKSENEVEAEATNEGA